MCGWYATGFNCMRALAHVPGLGARVPVFVCACGRVDSRARGFPLALIGPRSRFAHPGRRADAGLIFFRSRAAGRPGGAAVLRPGRAVAGRGGRRRGGGEVGEACGALAGEGCGWVLWGCIDEPGHGQRPPYASASPHRAFARGVAGNTASLTQVLWGERPTVWERFTRVTYCTRGVARRTGYHAEGKGQHRLASPTAL
jgi:hypothetical protein